MKSFTIQQVLGLVWACLCITSVAGAGSISAWSELARKHGGVIPLNPQRFIEITSKPRDYTVSVLMTARSSRFGCATCKQFDPEYDLVASQWIRSSRAQEHAAIGEHVFFARLDFDDGQEIFRRLNIAAAPTLQLYRPSNTPTGDSIETFDFNRLGPKAETFISFIQHRTPFEIPFKRPVDYSRLIQFILGGTAIVAFLIRFRSIFTHRIVWACLTSAVTIFFISGHMWNRIRNPPFVMLKPNREVSYVAVGYQNQLGIESYLVSFLYAMLGFSAYSLAVLIPNLAKHGDLSRQRAAIYVWLAVIFTLGSVLIAFFRIKNPSYPFRGFF